jgi:hypothetical protein
MKFEKPPVFGGFGNAELARPRSECEMYTGTKRGASVELKILRIVYSYGVCLDHHARRKLEARGVPSA